MGERPPPDDPAGERGRSRAAAAARIQQQATWVDLQLQRAVARGDFDALPGFGKPIGDLGGQHDPDWWVKRLIEREQISGVLPPALQLRKDDAALDALLDRQGSEDGVRREVEDFNARVRAALYQPLGGPPLVTRERNVDAEVARWRDRRPAAAVSPVAADAPATRRRGWGRWRHRRGSGPSG